VSTRNLTYVAEPDFYTLLINHGMTIPRYEYKWDLPRGAQQMKGIIVGTNGKVLDPCQPYLDLGRKCPDDIHFGVKGCRDIIPVKTLLQAAGISSFDLAASNNRAVDDCPGGTDTSLYEQTLRHSGFTLLVNIHYSNMGCSYRNGRCRGKTMGNKLWSNPYDKSEIWYELTAAAIPDSEYKSIQVTSTDVFLRPNRTAIDRHGVRIMTTTSSTVGVPDVMTVV